MTEHKIRGVAWQGFEPPSLLRFKLKGYPIYVEWSSRGWHYFWEGQGHNSRVFYRTRAAAMLECLDCLERARKVKA